MADRKITELPAITAVTADDLLVVVNDPGGSPATSKITVANFIKYEKGIAFPGGPAAGDVFFRTDLGWLCYYDGTRWLTAHEYFIPFGVVNNGAGVYAANISIGITPVRGDYPLYLTRVLRRTNVAATNDGTHHWYMEVRTWTGSWAFVVDYGEVKTDLDTAGVETDHDTNVNVVVSSTVRYIALYIFKNNTPGNLTGSFGLYHRLIVT